MCAYMVIKFKDGGCYCKYRKECVNSCAKCKNYTKGQHYAGTLRKEEMCEKN